MMENTIYNSSKRNKLIIFAFRDSDLERVFSDDFSQESYEATQTLYEYKGHVCEERENREIIKETEPVKIKVSKNIQIGYTPLLRNLNIVVTLSLLIWYTLNLEHTKIAQKYVVIFTLILTFITLRNQNVPNIKSVKDNLRLNGNFYKVTGVLALVVKSILFYSNGSIDKILVLNMGIWMIYYDTARKNFNPDHETAHIGQYLIFLLVNLHGNALYNENDSVTTKIITGAAIALYVNGLSAIWSHGYFSECLSWFRQSKFIRSRNRIVNFGYMFEPLRGYLQAFGPEIQTDNVEVLLNTDIDIRNKVDNSLLRSTLKRSKRRIDLRRILPISCNAREHPIKLVYVLSEIILMIIIPFYRTRRMTAGIAIGIVFSMIDLLPVPFNEHGSYLYNRCMIIAIITQIIR